MNDDIIKLKHEIKDLIMKYSDRLNAGQINESIVCVAVIMACNMATRTGNSLQEIEDDHIKFIKEHIINFKLFLHEKGND